MKWGESQPGAGVGSASALAAVANSLGPGVTAGLDGTLGDGLAGAAFDAAPVVQAVASSTAPQVTDLRTRTMSHLLSATATAAFSRSTGWGSGRHAVSSLSLPAGCGCTEPPRVGHSTHFC